MKEILLIRALHFEEEIEELRFSLLLKSNLLDTHNESSVQDFNKLLQQYHAAKSFLSFDKKFMQSAEEVLAKFKGKKLKANLPKKSKGRK